MLRKQFSSFQRAWAMGPSRGHVHNALSLCAILYMLLCIHVASNTNVDYCRELELKLEPQSEIQDRALSLNGEPRILKLCAHDAAPEAARALLRALIVHGLRYREREIEEADCSLEELQELTDAGEGKYWVLSVATAWRDEGTITGQCVQGACGLAGSRLDVLGRGVAPADRRLLARLAPGAQFHCLQSWNMLRSRDCGFLDDGDTGSYSVPCSNWPNITCSGDCLTLAIVAGRYEAEQCHLAQELAKVAGPLSLTFTSDLVNRSYLYFDYDIWIDKDRIWPAPQPNLTTPDTVSLSLGDVRKLLYLAPPILNLAFRLKPPPDMLRRVLSSKLDVRQAACEAIVSSNDSIANARDWLKCNDTFCNMTPKARIYICKEEEIKDNRYATIVGIVKSYYYNMTNQTGLEFVNVKINCSITDEVKTDLENALTYSDWTINLRGVVAMGSGGASTLPDFLRSEQVPLLLVDTPPNTELDVRSTAPSVPVVVSAVRRLLAGCGWRRVALLREEGRSDVWKRSLGVAEALRKQVPLTHQEIVHADNASDALDALVARDARVVLIDASAATASNLLTTAEERGMTKLAGYAWIVVGAAGNSSDSDWLPSNPEFSYVTISGGWRGGPPPSGLLGSSVLRDALDEEFQRWPPHASALVDALLLMLEGTSRLEKLYPEHRHDPHRPGVFRTFFEILDNTTVVGTTHNIRANSSPPVFVHRWNSRGAQLLAAWDGPNSNLYFDKDQLCGGIVDGPGCYTSRSGDRFKPHCHDFAWAILVCALALGVPSLYAARAARRRRLKLRDRAVEERVLLRGGHSAAEAAAGAALSEHAVPRDALQLLDKLGTGHYGVVHQAVLRRPSSAALGVAAKVPRADAPSGSAAELLREAALLATLRHDHIVRFIGVCWEGGPLVLMEHAFYGDLRRYLRARRTLAERARAGFLEPEAAHVAAAALTRLAREAASALGYLANQRLVHRDIRAANCLVDVRRSLKLADFGMARRLGKAGEGEYLCKRRAMFPVLWMAPESLSNGVFSTASDVWALGVLLLELATLGERPYGAWATARVLRHVRGGGAPSLPQDVAPSTRAITAACWNSSPEERTSAAELVAYLADNPRAIQPALEPYANGDTNSDAQTDVYIDEWTN